MNIRILLPLLSATLLFSGSSSICGQGLLPQDNQEKPVRETRDTAVILPYEQNRITEAFNESNLLISESAKKHFTREALDRNRGEVDTLFRVIDGFLGDSTLFDLEEASVRELQQIEQRSYFYSGETDRLQKRLSDESQTIEKYTASLYISLQRWQLTSQARPGAGITENRTLRIERTIAGLDSVRTLLLGDLDMIQVLQDGLSDRKFALETLQSKIRDLRSVQGERLFSRDMPGFFSDLSTLGDPTLIPAHISQLKKSIRTDREILKADFSGSVIVAFVLMLVCMVLANWYKRHFARMVSVEQFELSETHLALIYSPVVTVLFITSVLIRFILPDLPHMFNGINLVIMMVPMTIIVIRIFGRHIRSWILVLVVLYTLTFLYELSYHSDIILRIILLCFSLTGLWLFIWANVKEPLASRFKNNLVYRIFRLVLIFFNLLLFIAVIANLAGAFRLAEFFTLLPIQIAVLAVAIHTTIKVAETLVFLTLASKSLQKVNVIREEFDVIYRKTTRLIDLLLWIFFFSVALKIFRVQDEVFEWGRALLTEGKTIGAIDYTVGNILIFVFVIWLSVTITRMVRYVLEKDVFTRVSTAKGIPGTIILLVRIVMISGGFFLAAAAAGMELTNLSIVLGAFSVGIGFGLQNIFNNMVSGLILAFERPIKVGDVVQVGELIGTVKTIGFRSSTIHSFDGAEVIVPNGNLISNEMINWTLSDSFRRMDIRIGVAYGSDPEVVLDLMNRIAADHPKVKKLPAPQAYFIGFGDSSLDFRLLAWAHIDERLETESAINVLLNQRLKEAGIEIPFPQRDLHIRSDDTRPQKMP